MQDVLVQFGVLGPLEVRYGDAVVEGLAPRQRRLLARLLVAPNRVVSTDRLLEELWDDPTSPGARSSLQAQASRLRSRLPIADVLVGDRVGYRISVASDGLDAWAFERLLGDGRSALDDARAEQAAVTLDEALSLWRGEPYVEIADDGPGAAEAARLRELRLIAQCDRGRADLACGRPADALARAEPMAADHPFDERIWALRITALYASSRQKDALAEYQRCRRLLRDELGVEPSVELRRLEQAVLAQDPLLAPAPKPGHVTVVRPTPVNVQRSDVGDAGLVLPPVSYTSNDGVTLAYRCVGDAHRGVDVVWVPDYLSHLDVLWEHPGPASFLQGLARLGRLITYDKRGQGLSDRTPEHPPIDVRVADLLAVLDAAESGSTVLVGCSEGAHIALSAAVAAPDRVSGLVLFGSGPVSEPDDGDGDWSLPMDKYVEWIEWAAARWGTGRSLAVLAPTVSEDPTARAWCGRLERQTITPTRIVEYGRENAATDYRSLLAHVRVPTLVLHRTDDPVPVKAGRYLGRHIPGAQYVELEGGDHLAYFGDSAAIVSEIRDFVDQLSAL